MKKKPVIKVTKKLVYFKDNIVSFPKGPSPVKGVFDLEFGAYEFTHKCYLYKIVPKESEKYKDMVRDLNQVLVEIFL